MAEVLPCGPSGNRPTTRERMLSRIKSARESLRKSERKVADVVLSDPDGSVQTSIQALACQAQVSEPTVIRFCRALDCVGFQEFKLKLARDLASRGTFIYQDVSLEDSTHSISNKIIESAMASLGQVRNQISHEAIDKAVQFYLAAKRVEFYGSGGSAVVAEDAQLKFFRLGIPAVAYSDPHIQDASAALLDSDALVIAISASGRSKSLLQTAKLAKGTGAKVIAVTATGSPLSEIADLNLYVDVVEDSDIFAPIKSRIAQIVLLDILSVGVAVKGGESMIRRVSVARRAIDNKFVPQQ